MPDQEAQVRDDLHRLFLSGVALHVGDAKGLDATALNVAAEYRAVVYCYRSSGPMVWQLQQRSRRLVEILAQNNGTLHAWPRQPCPANITVNSWKGSGTWGTIRYAVSRAVPIEIHPLAQLEMPEWLELRCKQLTLW